MLRVADQFAKTDTGRQRRSNEDSYFLRSPLFAVADGMGGARAGEVASKLLVDTLEAGLSDHGPDEERLADRVREANQRIHELAQRDADRAGMGTTATAAYVGEDSVSVAHVGDSRAYRMRDGQLEQLTRDHSLVEELKRRGKLTEEEAEEHPQRSVITRALGPESRVKVDTLTVPARGGDVFLLCSDGLSGMVPEERIQEIVSGAASMEEAGRRLIEEANRAGGRDNITVVLFRVEEVEAPSGGDQPTAVGMPAVSAPTDADGEGPAAAEAAPAAPKRTMPLPPREAPPRERPRRGRIRGLAPTVVVLAILAMLGAGAWIATRAMYFVGTTDDGFVAVYRGLPYELPAGLKLYQREYTSGVHSSQVPAARRRSLLDHELRSEHDAADLVRKLERDQVIG
jgi:serine/threonine protein phosphatase PrpC